MPARRSLPLQVRDELRGLIEAESLRPGDQLPTEAEIAVRFGVARTTAREAYKLLEQDGVIDVRHGLGRYLSPLATLDRPITRLESVTEMMASRGYAVENRVLDVAVGPADDEEAAALEQRTGDEVIRLARLRLHGAIPLIYSVDVLPRTAMPERPEEVDWSGSLLALLERNGRGAASAATRIQAATLPERARSLLVPEDAARPWLLLVQRHFDEDRRPLLYSRDYYRGDRFTFNVLRRRAQ